MIRLVVLEKLLGESLGLLLCRLQRSIEIRSVVHTLLRRSRRTRSMKEDEEEYAVKEKE